MNKLWSLEDIAAFASYSKKTAYRVVSQPDFPTPVEKWPRQWCEAAVVEWFKSKKEPDILPPERTALYRHFDAAGTLLYVGIAKDHLKRLYAHMTFAPWRDEIARIEVEWLPSRQAALAAEATAIADERPLHNIIGRIAA